MKNLMAILNYLMMAAFILSVAVQFNDPDPLPWMLMYGLAAGACLLFAMGRMHPLVSGVPGTIALLWAFILMPGVLSSSETLTLDAVFGTTEMINERVEVVREIGGLLITAAWMVVLSILSFRQQN